jgi:hypothetical protein
MKNNQFKLLEEAYLSITKKRPDDSTPMSQESEISDDVSTDPNSIVSVGAMEEPAPGINMNLSDSGSEDNDTSGIPVSMSPDGQCDGDYNMEQEDEEDQMTLDNLNSIRESVMKVASFCATGGHLEIWAQQKLAIAMDNLAEVARRLR